MLRAEVSHNQDASNVFKEPDAFSNLSTDHPSCSGHGSMSVKYFRPRGSLINVKVKNHHARE